MLGLSRCTVTRDGTPAGGEAPGESPPRPSGRRAAEFMAWLASQDLRLPDAADVTVEGTRPDLLYRLPDGNVAVFVFDSGEHDDQDDQRNEAARDTLRDLGWGVITIGPDAGWPAVAGKYPSVFGSR